VLERISGLNFNKKFFAGYSPETINPGDKEYRVTTIKKVTFGSTLELVEEVDQLYAGIIAAGTHNASSIKVAELVKAMIKTNHTVANSRVLIMGFVFKESCPERSCVLI